MNKTKNTEQYLMNDISDQNDDIVMALTSNTSLNWNSSALSKRKSDFGEAVKVGLYTGRVTYCSFDTAIGANKRKISVSHVYSSAAANDNSFSVGLGWRLNIQQTIRQIGTVCEYIDGEGYKHVFDQSINVYGTYLNEYYDNEGLNLTIIYPYVLNSQNYFKLVDGVGNAMLFNESGRLIKILYHPVNWDNIEASNGIKIEYTGTSISKVFHQLDTNNYIQLSYDSSNRVSSIAVKQGNQTLKVVSYTYGTGGELLSKTYNGLTEKYTYNADKRIETIVDTESCLGYKVVYNTEGTVNRLNEGYLSDINNVDSLVVKAYSSFSYTKSSQKIETIVTNDQNVRIAYGLDSMGEIVSVLEKGEGNRYSTLQNEYGKFMFKETSSADDSFNNCAIVSNTSGKYSYSGTFSVYSGDENYKCFILSCYIKIFSSQNTVDAIVNYKHNGQTYRNKQQLNGKAVGVWQKISIPITLNTSNSKDISNFALMVYTDAGVALSFQCTPILFTPKSISYVVFEGSIDYKLETMTTEELTVNAGVYPLEIGKKVQIDGAVNTFNINRVTYQDLLNSAKNFYLNKNGYNNVSINGGRVILPDILSVQFVYIGNVNDRHAFDLINTTTGKCGFALVERSADGMTYTKTRTTFSTQGILTESTIGTGTEAKVSKSLTTYDGRPIYEEDIYGNRTEYTYDNFNNEIEVSFVKNGSKMILRTANYDTDGVYKIESGNSCSRYVYEYNKPFDDVKKECEVISRMQYSPQDENVYTKFSNNDKEQLTSVEFLYNNSWAIVKNELSYNKGNLRTASNSGIKFGLNTNNITDNFTLSLFNGDTEAAIYNTTFTKQTNTQKETITYSNGGSVQTTYNQFGKIVNTSAGFSVTYEDDNFGGQNAKRIKSYYDPYMNLSFTIDYDDNGAEKGQSRSDNNYSISSEENKISYKLKYFGTTSTTVGVENGLPKRVIQNNSSSDIPLLTCTYYRDNLGRVTAKKFNGDSITYNYNYKVYNNRNTPVVGDYTFNCTDFNIKHTYGTDTHGNLSYIKENVTYNNKAAPEEETEYEYSSDGKLVREKEYMHGEQQSEYEYYYNSSGQLTEKFNYLDNHTEKIYTYNSKGQLNSINNYKYYSYDSAGNRASIIINGNTFATYSWTRGNILASIARNGVTITYQYDNNGIRFKKINGLVTSDYYYDGTRLIAEMRSDGKYFRYYYDNEGVCGFSYNGQCYGYIRNIQGDIIGIFGDNGKLVARYTYDAWGSCNVLNPDGSRNTSQTFLGNINPIRYRGYYYDNESGLYYLITRYYDPEACQYISPDSVDYLDPYSSCGFNLYCYCNNNPISCSDPDGCFPFMLIATAFIAGFVAGAISSMLYQVVTSGSVDFIQMVISAFFSGISSAFAVTGFGSYFGQFLIQGALNVAETIALAGYENNINQLDAADYVFSFFTGAIVGLVGVKAARAEFPRFKQIEQSLTQNLKRGMKKGVNGFIQAWNNKSRKFINVVVLPEVSGKFKDAILDFVLDYSTFWIRYTVEK